MSWADIKRRYEKSGGTATQSTEDMAARRILRAIGVKEAELHKREIESGIGGLVASDATLFERAVNLARNRFNVFYPPPLVMDVKKQEEADAALMEMTDANRARMVAKAFAVIYRIKGGPKLYATICLGCTPYVIVEKLPLPATIRRVKGGDTLLADCDLQTYCDFVVSERNRENG